MPNLPWQGETIWQLTLIANQSGAQIVNTHHFEAAGALDISMTDDGTRISQGLLLADDWIANLKTPWLACHMNAYTLTLVKVQTLEVKNLFRHKLSPSERAQTTGNTGSGVGAPNTLAQSAVVRWRTPIAGKRHRGRSYIGPVPGTFADQGTLQGAGKTAMDAYGSAMVARYGVGGTKATSWIQTIYSRPFNEGEYGYPQGQHPNRSFFYPEDYAGDSTNVTAYVTDTVLRTQRRRNIGVGA